VSKTYHSFSGLFTVFSIYFLCRLLCFIVYLLFLFCWLAFLIIYTFAVIISWCEIYALLMVFIPTCKAIYQPAILPNLSKFCLHVTNFLHASRSPQFNAQLNEAKNCYSPRFLTDLITVDYVLFSSIFSYVVGV